MVDPPPTSLPSPFTPELLPPGLYVSRARVTTFLFFFLPLQWSFKSFKCISYCIYMMHMLIEVQVATYMWAAETERERYDTKKNKFYCKKGEDECLNPSRWGWKIPPKYTLSGRGRTFKYFPPRNRAPVIAGQMWISSSTGRFSASRLQGGWLMICQPLWGVWTAHQQRPQCSDLMRARLIWPLWRQEGRKSGGKEGKRKQRDVVAAQMSISISLLQAVNIALNLWGERNWQLLDFHTDVHYLYGGTKDKSNHFFTSGHVLFSSLKQHVFFWLRGVVQQCSLLCRSNGKSMKSAEHRVRSHCKIRFYAPNREENWAIMQTDSPLLSV